MRGLPMKVGQLFVQDEDDEMAVLVDGVQGMEQDAALRALVEGVGQNATRIELGSLAHAASLGQVHRGWDRRHGRELAIKIQYPDIAENIWAELAVVGLLPKVGPVARYGFDLSGYKKVLEDQLRHELDYEGEARRQMGFREETRIKGLLVPQVYSELCGKKVLTQEWLAGNTLAEAREFPKAVRLRIARTLLSTLLEGLFVTGKVHGDPHRGNYKFRPSGEVVLYDFGSVLEIPVERRVAFLSLLLRLRRNPAAATLDWWVAMGFDAERLKPLEGKLSALSLVLFEPFLKEGAFDPSSWNLKARFEQLLGELRWWFRAAGPAELFLVMRAFSGLLSFFRQLDVRLPWWAVLQHGVPSEVVQVASSFEPSHIAVDPRPAGHAEHLCVTLTRPEQRPFSLTFPAVEALHLSDRVPPEVIGHDERRLLRTIETRLATDGLEPQVLLEGTSARGRYRIWLR